jgi:replicative DNA helicase
MIDIEPKILTAMIVNSSYLQKVVPMYKQSFFKLPFVGIMSQWIVDYYNEYKQCPYFDIANIFKEHKKDFRNPADIELASTFLDKISDDYESGTLLEINNVDYFVDETQEYFAARSLNELKENVHNLILAGKTEEAEQLIKNYAPISRSLSRAVSVENEEEIDKTWDSRFSEEVPEEKRPSFLFKPIGALGDLIGGLHRNWLVAIEGPYKRGKSWWLLEFAREARMNGCKVLFISLEMDEDDVKERYYKMVMQLPETATTVVQACFDCYLNQIGGCNKTERVNRIPLYSENSLKPKYADSPEGYKTCTVCQGTDKFVPDNWWKPLFYKGRTLNALKKEIRGYNVNKAFMRSSESNFELLCYPMDSATFTDITADMERLEYDKNFVPDVVVVDYLDICASEHTNFEYRHQLDSLWKSAKKLAAEKHALLITATQTNKMAMKKGSVDATDVAEEGRKLGHVDLMIALNQMEDEKEQDTVVSSDA